MTGPAGATGAAGETGPTGATGTINAATYFATETYTCAGGGCGLAVRAFCDQGDRVLDGRNNFGTFDDRLRGGPDSTFRGWEVFADLGMGDTITVTALCLDLGDPHEE